jgi:ABC-type transport system involved in multi-copper enzyme maturation permease subunit
MELLKIEILKIRHYTVFRAFMLIFIVLLPLIIFSISLIKFPGFPSQGQILGFPYVWSNLTYIAGWVNLLPGILVVALVCNEISFKTQKQNVIDGLSRLEVILSKFYVVLSLTVLITAYVAFLGLIFGLIYSSGGNVFSGIENLLFFFIQTLGMLSLAMLMGVLIRISSLSILGYIFVFFFLGIIIEQSTNEAISQWMPTNMLADLTPFPLYDDVTNMQRLADPNMVVVKEVHPWVRALLSTFYTGGFIVLSFFTMKHRDL